jgi:hypothetical protein
MAVSLGMSKPGVGSDRASQRTRAMRCSFATHANSRQRDGVLVDRALPAGQKIWAW